MGKVWGGIRVYDTGSQDAILEGLQSYVINPQDPKAAIILNAEQIDGFISGFLIFYFYDGPTPNAAGYGGLYEISPLLDLTYTWDNYADLV